MAGGAIQGLISCLRQRLALTLNANSGTTDYTPGFTVVDKSTAIPNGRVVTDIGVFSNSALTFPVKIVLRNSATNYDVAVSESFAHGGTGLEYKQLSAQFGVPGTGSYFLAAYATGTRNTTAVVARAFLAGDQAVAAGIAGWAEDTAAVFPLSYKYLA